MLKKKLKILTWQIHGNYLYYLSHVEHELYIPYKPERPAGYNGCFEGFPWPDTVINVPVDRVPELDLDCILFQRPEHYERDQYEILSEKQRRLPKIYLEHDPPREHPTDSRHIAGPDVLLVHVTPFNLLMWDNGPADTRVIDHGVVVPAAVEYSGEIPKGLVVVNNIRKRGRRLGLDIFEAAREEVPLDIVGMGSGEVGGLGEVSHADLPAFEARYRFLFNPIRYTSLGLAVCEAMTIGMPVVGVASTEMAKAIENGVSGYVETDFRALVGRMRQLIADHGLARRLGQGARAYAAERFNINRFVRDWHEVFYHATR